MESNLKLMPNLNTGINSELNTNMKPFSKKNNKDRIGFFEKYNSINNIEEIFNKKYKAFEALENLIINDKKNSKNFSVIKIHKNSSKSNTELINFKDRNKTVKKYLNTEIIPIPKLDFSRIYKKYNQKKLLVKEISIKSDINKINNDDEENKKIIDKLNLNHKHLHNHK